MNQIKKLRHLWAVVLFIISLLLFAIGVGAPFADTMKENFWGALLYADIKAPIVFSVGTGLFASMVIWFFAVYCPEQKRRKILRGSMHRCYQSFRRRVLGILCQPLRDAALTLEELQDHKKFRAFFKQNDSEYWHKVVGFLRGNQYYIGEILHEMDILCREATHVRDNIDIQSPEVHNFLGNMVAVLSQYQNSHLDYSSDDLKPFMRCLFGIFALSNIQDGQMEKDPIKTMIDEI